MLILIWQSQRRDVVEKDDRSGLIKGYSMLWKQARTRMVKVISNNSWFFGAHKKASYFCCDRI